MSELFDMGKYGTFVWSSYLLTVLVVLVTTIQGRRRHRRIAERIRRGLEAGEDSE